MTIEAEPRELHAFRVLFTQVKGLSCSFARSVRACVGQAPVARVEGLQVTARKSSWRLGQRVATNSGTSGRNPCACSVAVRRPTSPMALC
jgi:hypothetical protein